LTIAFEFGIVANLKPSKFYPNHFFPLVDLSKNHPCHVSTARSSEFSVAYPMLIKFIECGRSIAAKKLFNEYSNGRKTYKEREGIAE